MKVTGHILNAQVDLNGKLSVTFSINEKAHGIAGVNELGTETLLDITAEKHKEKRSKDANALFWACCRDLATALKTDKDAVHDLMLKRYGVFGYGDFTSEENAKRFMRAWGEPSEIVAKLSDGTTSVLYYFGSHTYNSKEFSALLDGVISEMKEVGITPPLSKDIERSLETWAKRHG